MFDIITIGTATIDHFIQVEKKEGLYIKRKGKKLQSFILGAKEEIKKPIVVIGGGAYNSAVTFARAGKKVGIISKIGGDLQGSHILTCIQKEKIQPLITIDGSEITGTSYILVGNDGERTILSYRGPAGNLIEKDVPINFAQAKWAYVVPGSMTLSELTKIFNHLQAHDIKIVFSPSKHVISYGLKKLQAILNKTHIVILNREEAALLTGISEKKKKDIFKKLDKHVLGIAVMTDGSSGAMVSDGVHMYTIGTFSVKKVIDKTGAGDAFGSGFVNGLIDIEEACEKGKSDANKMAYALRYAAANSTAVIEKIGATEGIITEKMFENSRWKKLKMKIETL